MKEKSYFNYKGSIRIYFKMYSSITTNWTLMFIAWSKEGIEYHVNALEKGDLNGLYGKDVELPKSSPFPLLVRYHGQNQASHSKILETCRKAHFDYRIHPSMD